MEEPFMSHRTSLAAEHPAVRARGALALVLAVLVGTSLAAPANAQGGYVDIRLGNTRETCVSQNTGWVASASLGQSCELMPGFSGSASGFATAGRVGITTSLAGASSDHSVYQHATASASATWMDRLRWTAPDVSTVIFTVGLTGSTYADVNGADPYAIAFGQGGFSMNFTPRPTSGDDYLSMLEGVGYGTPNPGLLTHTTSYDVSRSYTIDVGHGTNLWFQMAIQMGNTLYTGQWPDRPYVGSAGSEFGHTVKLTGLTFEDAQGAVMENVLYSFDNGTAIYAVTSAPEPASTTLLATGLLGIGGLLLRRRSVR
jgi:MYXO-CTERM domain-containing protein